jgi:putative phosphoribosyl transferase
LARELLHRRHAFLEVTTMTNVGQNVAMGERVVQIPAEEVLLNGNLTIPPRATGIILFAHGSGSSRLSPRNRFVATMLQQAGLGTLLFDLLTEGEAEDRAKVFDIHLLAQRLLAATGWLRREPLPGGVRLGYFGASTGAAAALEAAAALGPDIGAVVSRGGRPDLAEGVLPTVTAPTLLIVGGRDREVIALNEHALDLLQTEKQLLIVPGATHLFEEPGALDQVADAASRWFSRYLV